MGKNFFNGSTTTKYFLFGRGTCQSDRISDAVFVLALTILFILIKLKSKIEGMTVFDYSYIYSAYADDTTFLLKDIISVKHIVDTFFFCSFQD